MTKDVMKDNLVHLISDDNFDHIALLSLAYQIYHIKESSKHNKDTDPMPDNLTLTSSVELYPLPHNPASLQFGYGLVEARLKSDLNEGEKIININLNHEFNEDQSLIKINGRLTTSISMK